MTSQINGLQGRNNKRMPPPVPRHHSLDRSSGRSCNPTFSEIVEVAVSVAPDRRQINGKGESMNEYGGYWIDAISAAATIFLTVMFFALVS